MGQQLFATNSLGGYLKSDSLSSYLRHVAQPMFAFRRFTQPESAVGKKRGDTFLFDKISNIATAGGTLVETTVMPKSNFTVIQDSMTITEYGNSIPYTGKLDVLAEVSVPENTKKVLNNDMAKVLDSAAAVQFQTSDYKATCETTASTVFGSAGTAGTAAGASMSDKNVRDIVDRMKILLIPKYANGRYNCVASTLSLRGLYDFFEAKAAQTTMAPLMDGMVGEYYGCKFFEETNILSNVINSSYGEAVFFGDDAVREGIAIPEEIRIKIPEDYGRDLGIAWYALLGFKKVWDYSTDSETRIIHVTST